MTITFTASRLVMASAFAAALLSAPVITAPPASAACPASTIADPRTGVCWPQSQTTLGISGPGGICLPGRIGLCLGGLQNSPIPGAAIRPQVPAGANRVWP
ncbi:hypothetical protein [Mycolicibacterium sp.]|uniref:hypothetical protein n=1 Tax=Mycolicibacterium sp. TaxID=2320850 RepID=UPI0025E6EA74|nr:hypothetical protein [Mycolicibacterium sp.]MCB9410627.1 hypothetical protein [Mycolicibacterium sp.]